MNNLRVTTIQTQLHWENADANHAMLEEKISRLEQPTDVIVLPEMFTTGFSMNAKNLAEPMNFHTTKWMKNMARKTDALMLGSVIIKESEKFFNRLLWVEPNGEAKIYDKRHLFRMAEEEKIYSPGDKILIAEWRDWKICPLVCYDLRFPAWSRNKFDKTTKSLSYDLLIYVANWPQPRSLHWQALLKARAIENLSYTVGVNRVGEDEKKINYEGRSLVIDPRGEMLLDAGSLEAVNTTELSAEDLKNWRARFPAYLDADDFELKN
jgi:predicted amidohydrolase